MIENMNKIKQHYLFSENKQCCSMLDFI